MTKWCQECIDLKKKRKLQAEDAEAQTRQNELLQESLHRLTGQRSTAADSQDPLETMRHPELAFIFNEVKRLSVIYMEKYVSDHWVTLHKEIIEECHEQWTWIYRIILLPQHVLRSLLFQFGDIQAKVNFRRLCITIHPDKNPHELASKAFQKILEIYQHGANQDRN